MIKRLLKRIFNIVLVGLMLITSTNFSAYAVEKPEDNQSEITEDDFEDISPVQIETEQSEEDEVIGEDTEGDIDEIDNNIESVDYNEPQYKTLSENTILSVTSEVTEDIYEGYLFKDTILEFKNEGSYAIDNITIKAFSSEKAEDANGNMEFPHYHLVPLDEYGFNRGDDVYAIYNLRTIPVGLEPGESIEMKLYIPDDVQEVFKLGTNLTNTITFGGTNFDDVTTTVNLNVYNPENPQIRFGEFIDRTDGFGFYTFESEVDAIDLGTIEIGTDDYNTGRADKKQYGITNLSSVFDPQQGKYPYVEVYYSVEGPDANVFEINTHAGWSTKFNLDKDESFQFDFDVKCAGLMPGVYTANLHLLTHPVNATLNGEMSGGEFDIPIKLQVDGGSDYHYETQAVTGLKAEAGDGYVKLSWDDFGNPGQEYRIYRKRGYSDSYSLEESDYLNTIYYDYGFENGETVGYKVAAVTPSEDYDTPGIYAESDPVFATPYAGGKKLILPPDLDTAAETVERGGKKYANLSWTLNDEYDNGDGKTGQERPVWKDGKYILSSKNSAVDHFYIVMDGEHVKDDRGDDIIVNRSDCASEDVYVDEIVNGERFIRTIKKYTWTKELLVEEGEYAHDFYIVPVAPDGQEGMCSEIYSFNRVGSYLDFKPYKEKESGYTISFDGNGGFAKTATKKLTAGSVYGELPSAYRSNYSFIGWFTAKNGGTEITPETEFTVNSNQTLYAHWGAKEVTVSFNANGGSVGETSKIVKYDSVYGELPEPTRLGYTFEGWYTAEAGGDLVNRDNTVSTDVAHTLYAHWVANRYTVSFDTCGAPRVADITVTYNSPYGELPEPSMAGGEFLGWYTAAVDGAKVNATDIYTLLDNQMLFAHWTWKYSAGNPVFSITSKTKVSEVSKGTKVSISTATSGATIYYSTDGNDPEIADENIYQDAIEITEPVTIKAIAVKDGYNNSDIVFESYTIKDESDAWGDVLEGDKDGFATADAVYKNLWVRGISDKSYTGKAITFPELRVYKGKDLLKATTDYTVAYKNNTKAGIATVTITGKGNYAGTIVKTFKINKVDISRANAADIVLAYNKRVQKGTTTVTCTVDGVTNTLKANTDFKYVYPKTDNKAADYDVNAFNVPGEYEVTITGNGNFEGTTTFTETITEKKLISKMTVKGLVAKMPYTGSGVTQENLEVWDGKTKLTEGEDADYTVSYGNNTEIGKASITITGKGDYIGTKTVTFDITGYNIKSAVFGKEVTGSYPYTGSEIKPLNPETSLTYKKSATDIVTLKGIEKSEYEEMSSDNPEKRNYDYTYEYSGDTKNVGRKGTIIIQGINSYTGTVTKTFSITAKPFDGDIEITVAPATYQKGGSKPTVTVKDGEVPLTEGVDYTVAYSNNTKVHDGNTADAKAPTVKITGKGNYKGVKPVTYAITPSDIANVTVAALDVVYQYKAGICKPKITVTDTDGKALAAGTDYDKNIKYTYVKETTVSRLIDAKKKIYDEFVIIPGGTEVDLKEDIIQPGTEIKVSVTGKGNYAGADSKETTFRFVSADISKATVTVNAQNYTGRPVTLSKDDIKVKIGKELKKTDYEIVGYNKNTAKGSAEVIIKGVGNYGGTKTTKFNIVARSMNYTVVYEKNADDATGSMKTSLTALNGKVTANAFKRQGYTFAGWSFEPDGEVEIINKGNLAIDNPNEYGSTINLYAQWK